MLPKQGYQPKQGLLHGNLDIPVSMTRTKLNAFNVCIPGPSGTVAAICPS